MVSVLFHRSTGSKKEQEGGKKVFGLVHFLYLSNHVNFISFSLATSLDANKQGL
jgi:hypothetical protein